MGGEVRLEMVACAEAEAARGVVDDGEDGGGEGSGDAHRAGGD